MLVEDTFVVAPHDPSTLRKYIGVQAIKPDGVTIDMTFTLDQLDGGVANNEAAVAAAEAILTDWQNMQAKVDATLGDITP